MLCDRMCHGRLICLADTFRFTRNAMPNACRLQTYFVEQTIADDESIFRLIRKFERAEGGLLESISPTAHDFTLAVTFAASTGSGEMKTINFHQMQFNSDTFSFVLSVNFVGGNARAAGCVHSSEFDLLAVARLTLTLFGRMRQCPQIYCHGDTVFVRNSAFKCLALTLRVRTSLKQVKRNRTQ